MHDVQQGRSKHARPLYHSIFGSITLNSHFLNSMPDFRLIITVGAIIADLGFKGLVDDRHEEHG